MSGEYYDSKGIRHYSRLAADSANEGYVREERDAARALERQAQAAEAARDELKRLRAAAKDEAQHAKNDRAYQQYVLFLKESDDNARLQKYLEIFVDELNLIKTEEYEVGLKTLALIYRKPSVPAACRRQGTLTNEIKRLACIQQQGTELERAVSRWIEQVETSLVEDFFAQGLWIGDRFSTHLEQALLRIQMMFPTSCQTDVARLTCEQVDHVWETFTKIVASQIASRLFRHDPGELADTLTISFDEWYGKPFEVLAERTELIRGLARKGVIRKVDASEIEAKNDAILKRLRSGPASRTLPSSGTAREAAAHRREEPGSPTPPPIPGSAPSAGDEDAVGHSSAPRPSSSPQQQPVALLVDQIPLIGTIASGKVTFSDGKIADWTLDLNGQTSIKPKEAGYQPSRRDVMEFQKAIAGLEIQ